MDVEEWQAQLASARATGSGPDGLAEAVVDGVGRLIDLKLDPGLLRRPAGAAAKEILGAVHAAQEAARTRTGKDVDGLKAVMHKASADVEAYRQEARRQLDELNTLVSDLIRGREPIR